MSSEQLMTACLELPEEERAKLAEALLASLEDGASSDVNDEAYARELLRRSEAVRAGSAETHSLEEVLAQLRRQEA